MKKIVIWLVIFFLFLGIFKSTDFRLIEAYSYVVSMGIDSSTEENEYVYTFQIIDVNADEASSGGGSSDKSQYKNISIRAKSIAAGISIANAAVEKKLSLKHIKAIIFSDELEKDEIKKQVDNILTDYSVKHTCYAAMSEGKASDLLKEISKTTKDTPKAYIGVIQNAFISAGLTDATRIIDLYNNMVNQSNEPYIAYIGAKKTSEDSKKEGSDDKEKSESSQDKSSKSETESEGESEKNNDIDKGTKDKEKQQLLQNGTPGSDSGDKGTNEAGNKDQKDNNENSDNKGKQSSEASSNSNDNLKENSEDNVSRPEKTENILETDSYSIDTVPIKEDETSIVCLGIVIFDQQGKKMILNGKETNLLLMLKKRLLSGITAIDYKDNRTVTLFVRNNKAPKVKVNTDTEIPKINIELELYSYLVYQDGIDIEENENKDICSFMEEYFNKEMKKFLEKTSNEIKVDIADLGKYAKKNFIDLNGLEAYKWKDKYKDAEFDVKIKLNMTSSKN